MKDTHRELLEELFYQISIDIYNLTEKDNDEMIEAISTLSSKVLKLSDDVIFEDEIVYKRSNRNDIRISLV